MEEDKEKAMKTGKLKKNRVAIIGGGPVGALHACFMARRGFQVDLYEMREDIRTKESVFGRSINLALSCRGREALRAVGMEEEVIANGIPMYGRMIHDPDGSKRPIIYGTPDQYLLSIDRRMLNEVLLSAAEEKYSDRVRLHFNHKLIGCEFDKGRMTFERTKEEESWENQTVDRQTDVLIGCDGAYSTVRSQMMRSMKMDYKQTYIKHGYIELRIPPTTDNEFMLERNYCHLWPRHTFMLLALPNAKDHSFVATLFMPFEIFESLTDEQKLLDFFGPKIPDAIELIGREAFVETFFRLKPLPAISIKCDPYHFEDKAVLLGDAAHAMFPFYGQGMNCGLEDLLIFDDLMDIYDEDFGKVMPEFTRRRRDDAHAICDLAFNHYTELRSTVNSRKFFLKKYLDNLLYRLFPNTWIPLFTTVCFTRMRYSECLKRTLWQDSVLHRMKQSALLGFTVVSAYFLSSLLSIETIKSYIGQL